MNKQTILLIIDNCIAGGKTTLINKLHQRNPDWKVIQEAVPLDTNDEIHAFMTNKHLLQTHIASNLYNQYNNTFKNIKPGSIVIADRCWTSTKYFHPSSLAVDDFNQAIANIIEKNNVKIIYIYLKSNGKQLMENIKSRNRKEELSLYSETYLLEYFQSIYTPVQDLYNYGFNDLKYVEVDITDLEFYKNGHQFIENIFNI